jgi:cholesterol transport system auxiliary component
MTTSGRVRALMALFVMWSVLLVSGCATLFSPPAPASRLYTLDDSDAQQRPAPAVTIDVAAPVLLIGMPSAGAGFDTDRLVYVRAPHQLEAYADSQWVDTPARMLQPLIQTMLSRTGLFGAVLITPGAASGRWELDSEIVRLQHEVPLSRVRFTLRVTLIDRQTHAILMGREFDAVAATAQTNAAGAVVAANAAVADVLEQLAAACRVALDAGH